jgi:hypothetical protein
MISKFILIFCAAISFSAFAQDDNVTYKDGSYIFQTKYDDSTYIAKLTITNNNKTIFSETYEYNKIISINSYDLNGDGKKEYLIDFYTGGAHCCTIMYAGEIKNDKFSYKDSIFWGNSGYEVKDIDKDGELEIVGYSDMFAYAFTNYAQSFEPIRIIKYRYGKLNEATGDFEKTVENNIKELMENLKEYTSKGFDCPKTDSEETFNTDAGGVKALLAPITADYASIGRADEGYKLINDVYKCPDKNKFIKILKANIK